MRKKHILTVVSVVLASLFAIAGCVGCASEQESYIGPLHEEIEAAKANIASSSPESILDGWCFLVQNEEDEEAQAVIESLGGLPTPFTNLEELYRMGEYYEIGSPSGRYVNLYYKEKGLDLSAGSYWWEKHKQYPNGLQPTASFLSTYDISDPYIAPSVKLLFGDYENLDIAVMGLMYYGDETFAGTEVCGNFIDADATDDEAYDLLDNVVDLAGLGKATEKGLSEYQYQGDIEESKGSWGKLWYACGTTKEGGVPWYAVLRFTDDRRCERVGAVLGIIVSSDFSPNALSALEEFGAYGEALSIDILYFDVLDALFEGEQLLSLEDAITREAEYVQQGSIFGQNDTATQKEESTVDKSTAEEESSKKDEMIVETDEKQIWKVWATSSTLHFTGSYQGSGNYIVKVLDDNQDLEELVCNEIGDYVLDKKVSVQSGEMYYIQVEFNDGSYSMQWTGTGGA